MHVMLTPCPLAPPQHLSPSLGVEIDSRTYAADCRLWLPGRGPNWAVIRDTLFDEFVVAHTVGWWAKALAVRNQLLLWTVSVAFELMELTFSVSGAGHGDETKQH